MGSGGGGGLGGGWGTGRLRRVGGGVVTPLGCEEENEGKFLFQFTIVNTDYQLRGEVNQQRFVRYFVNQQKSFVDHKN